MRLKELQKKSNLTIKQNAEKLNIPLSTYNQYLINYREPNIKTLKKLAKYYDVSLDYLCENETTNLVDISSWNENKKGALFLLEQLNERNDIILLGYLTHMIAEQKTI